LVQRRRWTPLRSLGRHTTIGEMGLITRQPRSATNEAEVASVLYELSVDARALARAPGAGALPKADVILLD